MMEKLKPCPFCEGEASHTAYRDTYQAERHNVECTVCGAEAGYGDSTGGLSWTTKEAAYKQWNTRTPQSQWISVDEMLPKPLFNVLVKQAYQDDLMIAFIDRDGSVWVESCDNATVNGDAWLSTDICRVNNEVEYLKVTHWMPLPEIPQ